MRSLWVSTFTALAVLAAAQAWGDDESGYVWQSDSAVQPAGVQMQQSVNLSQALLAEAGAQGATTPSPSDRPSPPPPPPQKLPKAPAAPAAPATPAAPAAPAVPPLAVPPPAVAQPAATDYACEPCEVANEEFRLFRFPALECRGLSVRGWIDQGYTWNPDDPANGFNGPVTFNDRSNEYQLNQLYLIGEKVADNGGCGLALGGRIDLLYGTDWRFTQAVGLEEDWNNGRYGLAMPQLYGDVAYNNWLFRFGHFYTIIGYETVTAPDNFFYSHAYTHQYGEPFTHTGMLAKYKLSDKWSFAGGVHRGWDQWEDLNNDWSLLGGVTWTPNDKTSLAWAITTGDEPNVQGVSANRTMFSFVWTQQVSQKLKSVFEWDYGFQDDALAGEDAQWNGLAQYLFYSLNDRWALGARGEVFYDDDGYRVNGLGAPLGIPLSAVPAKWYELALGVNFKPNANVLIRSEARWDWVDSLVPVSDYPFDDFTDGSQFLLGTDLIVKF